MLSAWVHLRLEKLFFEYTNLADDCLILSSEVSAKEKYSL